MKLSSKLLKTLIIFYWVSFVMLLVGISLDGPEVSVAEDSLGMVFIGDGLAGVLSLAVIVLLIFSTIALYKLKPIGRTVFLLTLVAAIPLEFLMGYITLNPFASLANDVNGLTMGAILLLIYSEEGAKIFLEDHSVDS